MAQLSQEAEQAIDKYGLTVSDEARNMCSSMNNDADRQTKWVVNPMIQFLIEQTMNQLRGGRSNGSSLAQTRPEVTTTVKKPERKPEKPVVVDEPDDTGFGGLFD